MRFSLDGTRPASRAADADVTGGERTRGNAPPFRRVLRPSPLIRAARNRENEGMRDIEGTRRGEGLRGDDRDEDIHGRGGADRLLGRGGDDELSGGRGRDTLDGGPGDDELDGGGGRDRYVWGAGHDEIHWRPNDASVTVGPEIGIDDFATLRSLARSADDGDDVLIVVSDDHSLRLEDVPLSAISEDMFRFEASGTDAARWRRWDEGRSGDDDHGHDDDAYDDHDDDGYGDHDDDDPRD